MRGQHDAAFDGDYCSTRTQRSGEGKSRIIEGEDKSRMYSSPCLHLYSGGRLGQTQEHVEVPDSFPQKESGSATDLGFGRLRGVFPRFTLATSAFGGE